MNNSIPFTYLIGWSSSNTFYYGVRYARNCNPSELWKTYFTSSKYVKSYRESHGEPDVLIIRRTFPTGQKARSWENKVLRRMHIKTHKSFLNKTDNISPPSTYGLRFSEERRLMHSIQNSGAGNGMYGKRHTTESRMKMSSTKQSRPLSDTMKLNYSNAKAGKNHPNWGKKQKPHVILAMKEKISGVPKSAAHKQKLANAKLGSKHWNNGIISKLFKGEPPDDTWKLGRLKVDQSSSSNLSA